MLVQKRNQGPIGPSDSTGVLQKGPRDSANDGEDEDDLPMTILELSQDLIELETFMSIPDMPGDDDASQDDAMSVDTESDTDLQVIESLGEVDKHPGDQCCGSLHCKGRGSLPELDNHLHV
eukprot:XP_011677784.1 PREDICTED: uncharacterized protein LOC105444785 [Strongylocentrotus purpuratus]